jgi:hypothetical protein
VAKDINPSSRSVEAGFACNAVTPRSTSVHRAQISVDALIRIG